MDLIKTSQKGEYEAEAGCRGKEAAAGAAEKSLCDYMGSKVVAFSLLCLQKARLFYDICKYISCENKNMIT